MALNNFYVIVGLAVMIGIYWLLGTCIKKDETWKKVAVTFLCVASYCFIMYVDYRFGISLFALSVVVYYVAVMMNRKPKYKKILLLVGLIVAIGSLVAAKYLNFFLNSFLTVFGQDSVSIKLFLPLGISYYTLTAISYMVDVYRGKYEPTKSLTDIVLYLGYFPKLISGPIVRANKFLGEVRALNRMEYHNFEAGIQIFVYGLFKKMVIADHLGVFVEEVFRTPVAFHSLTVLLASVSYALQIYYDFSGYTDMAIGISKILGIDLEKNFNYPFVTKNITMFWRNWHMSLSSFLSEYVYISMGGNRKGKIRTYINLVMTMLIGGLWHGASWTYVVWGVMNGVALAVHKMFMSWKQKIFGDKNCGNGLWKAVSVLMTFFTFVFGLIWFRAESLSHAWQVFSSIIIWQNGIVEVYSWSVLAIILVVIFSIYGCRKQYQLADKVEERYPLFALNTVKGMVVFFTLCGLTMLLAYVGNTVFIYDAF